MTVNKRSISRILTGKGAILTEQTKFLLVSITKSRRDSNVGTLKDRIKKEIYGGDWKANSLSRNRAIVRMVKRANDEFVKYQIPLQIYVSSFRDGDKRPVWIDWTDDESRRLALGEDIKRAADWWIEQLSNGVIESHNPDRPELNFPLAIALTEANTRKSAISVLQYVNFDRILRLVIEDGLSKKHAVLLNTDHFKPCGVLIEVAARSELANVCWPEHAHMEIDPTGTIIVYPYYGAKMQEI